MIDAGRLAWWMDGWMSGDCSRRRRAAAMVVVPSSPLVPPSHGWDDGPRLVSSVRLMTCLSVCHVASAAVATHTHRRGRCWRRTAGRRRRRRIRRRERSGKNARRSASARRRPGAGSGALAWLLCSYVCVDGWVWMKGGGGGRSAGGLKGGGGCGGRMVAFVLISSCGYTLRCEQGGRGGARGGTESGGGGQGEGTAVRCVSPADDQVPVSSLH